ncbi:MAG: ester cyclase [Gammaproteobacteria bacterium]|nr:ester cyclase [Gammaproteobacteria bacterium]MDH5777244.1 ester cyclase [Gammaproteobacteria bacterium]
MKANESIVRLFYDEIWNKHNLELVTEIIHEQFQFRGSLGDEKNGPDEFCDYVEMVHQALSDYHCAIEELLCNDNKAFAKMRFSGKHVGHLLGYDKTGKAVSWAGAALFTFAENKIIDLWVLGDLTSLHQQLQQT